MNAPSPAETFLVEAEDLLDQIEAVALEASERPGDVACVDRLFRAFHTLKGSGAMFGFDAVSAFTHHVESALDRVRQGELNLSRELMELILAARDHIKALLEHATRGTPLDPARTAELVGEFNQLNETAPAPAPGPAEAAGRHATWRIRFRPPLDIASRGLDPLALIQELRTLGDCAVKAITEAVPPLECLQAEQCHLAWDIVLRTDRGLNAIRDVFIFVEADSDLAIERVPESAKPARATKATAAPAGVAALRTGARQTEARDAVVRVPAARLDRLVTLVGELVMNQSRLNQVAARLEASELAAPVEGFERLIAELRGTVLGIRMMPIGTTFGRFRRLVHDLAGELHKEIELVTAGADTELDKNVLDQLGDPLVHLIRNSVDHGIEPPEERQQAGKPRRGQVRLSAAHEGAHVAVTIEDNGRGLDARAIRAKATEKNLIAADAVLSEKEIFALVFLPGFSTARKVTSVSGRGVGLDVVRQQLDALRGTIQVFSTPGQGTRFVLSLPLTLAIIDGLLVQVDGEHFIVPMAEVHENVELGRAERRRKNGRNVIAVRGELVPYVRLRETFTSGGGEADVEKVVIVRHAGERVGVVVDRVLGSHQTVIQSLGRLFRGLEVFSGATILGDGRVALILSVAGLLRHLEQTEPPPIAVPRAAA